MKEAGYVYILTNPSFKEDWVKIGKSSRPVDIRSKELDNTAVPLPFEIYATLKTVKYEQVEKQLHRMIDRLTDLRIRPNREFFNVPPSKAIELLKDCAMTIDDAEITEFVPIENSYKCPQPEKSDIVRTIMTQPDHNKNSTFWAEFISYCGKNNGVFANISPSTNSWICKGIGASYGINMCAVVGIHSARIEIYFNGKNKELNKKVFDHLYSKKEDIESEYGRMLKWQRLDDKTACRIKDERDFQCFELADKSELFAFLKDASDKMSVIFHNYILEYKE